ncbi:hypothetical protein DUNSADRAFT_9127 [Dunaliella salina]|uniref:Uncharacterized protein n=1 Tax=Dunaliella salina TaxID=3046 RepID=A0ABZ3K8L1_DUNSA|nr:hypothetical protein DUNSADRAFT_9127 [Dunaliella salina]|eukprot:KAF5825509.1 hypothetical protein DUNSADRAFT_9127 [Dunaliella salina]
MKPKAIPSARRQRGSAFAHAPPAQPQGLRQQLGTGAGPSQQLGAGLSQLEPDLAGGGLSQPGLSQQLVTGPSQQLGGGLSQLEPDLAGGGLSQPGLRQQLGTGPSQQLGFSQLLVDLEGGGPSQLGACNKMEGGLVYQCVPLVDHLSV